MKHINDTSDMCPECTGSGMSCGEACHLMLETPAKPTYEEQLAWLDLVGLMATPNDKEMIKAIKENVIAVRNYEKALEFNSERAELNQSLDAIHLNWAKLKQHIDVKPFVFRAEDLNPREELLIDNRIKQLQGELQAQLSLKKQFRSKQAIDHCHTAINNLKKWKSQSL